jgi:hypothetical protein
MSGRQGPYVSKDAWQQPTARFEGETTMHHDYRKYAQPPSDLRQVCGFLLVLWFPSPIKLTAMI